MWILLLIVSYMCCLIVCADWAEEFEAKDMEFGAKDELLELMDSLIAAAPEPEEENNSDSSS